VRIQFDLNDSEWERISRYTDMKYRHKTGKDSLMEFINRREGRDKKLQTENEAKLIKQLEPVILKILQKRGII